LTQKTAVLRALEKNGGADPIAIFASARRRRMSG
jgi:hypothetical protein